jgi:hypothetical protein
MGRPVPTSVILRSPARKVFLRHWQACAVLLVLLAFCASYPCPSQARGASDDSGGNAFRLVTQALQARLRLVYAARQCIFWMTPTGDGVAQIIADIVRAGRRTRITYRFPAETAGRVMLDDGVHSSVFYPTDQALLIGPSAGDDQRAASPTTLALLRHNYCCSLIRRDVLNGCLCDVVMIRPRAGTGPSKRLWIDVGRYAILRTEEYDAEGCRRYVSFYETIRFLPRLPVDALKLPGAALGPQTRRVSMPSVETTSARQAFADAHLGGSLPAWCPLGFTLMHCTVTGSRAGARSVLLHYCDGLKSLTVLEEPCAAGHPTAAELNGALARYGQQVWIHEDGGLRMIVRGDLSLPSSLGAEMTHALCTHVDKSLAQGLARDFGTAAAKRGVSLRRVGWGYEQIAALLFGERSQPGLRTRLKPLLDRNASWSQIAAVFGTGAGALQKRSRAWVAATLAAAH